jgi:hypothetical protein
MNLMSRLSLASLLLLSGAVAQAACVYPQAPQSLPNGGKEYSKAVQEVYLPCLEQEKTDSLGALEAADPEYAAKKDAIEALHAKKHNAALDELTATATRWSEEIKAFNEASKK